MKLFGAAATTLMLLFTNGQDAAAQALPTASPEQVGLSAERLNRISELIRRDVERGEIPGAVVLVVRRGKIAYYEAFGHRDKANGTPMSKDAIFRIASMTKPFVSIATLMLLEEGRLYLTDPVSKHLPELAKLPVLAAKPDDPAGKPSTVPAEREMTIHDLLRHTSGLAYSWFGKPSPVKELYKTTGVEARDQTSAEMIEKLAKVPLQNQPGATWEYSVSTDVLGRVIEVVTGKRLGDFLEERLFRPLGMTDTGFWVSSEKHGRIAQPLPGEPPMRVLTSQPKFDSGGGGAASTALDFARFSQMLLNRGRIDGVTIVSRKAVELMTADHLGTIPHTLAPGYGFGLGVAVRKTDGLAPEPGSVGEYYWLGATGTHFFIDPKEELVAIFLAQHAGFPKLFHYRRTFKNLVMQTIAD